MSVSVSAILVALLHSVNHHHYLSRLSLPLAWGNVYWHTDGRQRKLCTEKSLPLRGERHESDSRA